MAPSGGHTWPTFGARRRRGTARGDLPRITGPALGRVALPPEMGLTRVLHDVRYGHASREVRAPHLDHPRVAGALLRPRARARLPWPAETRRHLRNARPDGGEGARRLDHGGEGRPEAVRTDG